MRIIINEKIYEFHPDLLDKFKTYLELDDIFSSCLIEAVEAIKQPTYTMNEITDLFENTFKTDSLSTRKNNLSTLNSILKLLEKTDVCIDYFHNSEDIITLFRNQSNLQKSTIKNYLHLVVKLYRICAIEPPRTYYTEIGVIKEEIEQLKSFEATPKEKIQLVWLEQHEDNLRQRLINSTTCLSAKPINFEKLALFSLHIDFPTFRREWGTIMCVSKDLDDGKTNYYNKVSSKISLNSFKNKTINTPQMECFLNTYPNVLETLNNWINIHPMKDLTIFPLFINKSGKAIKQSTFNSLMKEIFDDRPISVNILRKLYVKKHVFSGIHTPEDIKEIHRIMNHTSDTALNEYAKTF